MLHTQSPAPTIPHAADSHQRQRGLSIRTQGHACGSSALACNIYLQLRGLSSQKALHLGVVPQMFL